MSNNMDLWNKVCRPPKEALKTIKGGRLSGMTDVNPQWRLKVMTETFGPCGQGWHYVIDHLWTEPGPAETVMCFAKVTVTAGGKGVQGVGGSMLVARETAGLRPNDEGYKMAVTDALSTAMKTLGVAADIYAGLWDGSKYLEAPPSGEAPRGSARAATEDAFKALPKERQQVIVDTATQVRDFLAEQRDFDAYALCESLDTEGQLAIWSLFNATERRRIKEAKNAEMISS